VEAAPVKTRDKPDGTAVAQFRRRQLDPPRCLRPSRRPLKERRATPVLGCLIAAREASWRRRKHRLEREGLLR
jgi:hypothetical protein